MSTTTSSPMRPFVFAFLCLLPLLSVHAARGRGRAHHRSHGRGSYGGGYRGREGYRGHAGYGGYGGREGYGDYRGREGYGGYGGREGYGGYGGPEGYGGHGGRDGHAGYGVGYGGHGSYGSYDGYGGDGGYEYPPTYAPPTDEPSTVAPSTPTTTESTTESTTTTSTTISTTVATTPSTTASTTPSTTTPTATTTLTIPTTTPVNISTCGRQGLLECGYYHAAKQGVSPWGGCWTLGVQHASQLYQECRRRLCSDEQALNDTLRCAVHENVVNECLAAQGQPPPNWRVITKCQGVTTNKLLNNPLPSIDAIDTIGMRKRSLSDGELAEIHEDFGYATENTPAENNPTRVKRGGGRMCIPAGCGMGHG